MSETPLIAVVDLSVDFRSGEQNDACRQERIIRHRPRRDGGAGWRSSGSGKTVTALSILKLLPYPSASHPSGKILFNGENLLSLPQPALRKIRGNKISMIFQEPMTSLNPLHTVENQVGEVLMIHRGCRTAGRASACSISWKVGIADPGATAPIVIRTSFLAANGSG